MRRREIQQSLPPPRPGMVLGNGAICGRIGGSIKRTVLGPRGVDWGCEPRFIQAKVISEELEQKRLTWVIRVIQDGHNVFVAFPFLCTLSIPGGKNWKFCKILVSSTLERRHT